MRAAGLLPVLTAAATPLLLAILIRWSGGGAGTHRPSVQAYGSMTASFREGLCAQVGGHCSAEEEVLRKHGKDESYHVPYPPDLVLYPRSTAEVSKVHKLCHDHRVPIIPFGAGTSLEGHIAAIHGGVALDMSRMNEVLSVDVVSMVCHAQAGVLRKQLEAHLVKYDAFFSVDPGADATMGGMTATRASGSNSVRYGTMRDNVLALEAVLADGTVVQAGRAVRKSAAGYDLAHLITGSEGTLATITSITVRIWPRPGASAVARATFPSLAALAAAAVGVARAGAPVARMEMLDEVTARAVNAYSGLRLPEMPMLLFEFGGTAAGAAPPRFALPLSSSHPERRAGCRPRLYRRRCDIEGGAMATPPGVASRGATASARSGVQLLIPGAPFPGVQEARGICEGVVTAHGGSRLEWSTDATERERIWAARHHAYWASVAARPGARGYTTDVVVPLPELPGAVVRAKALVEAARLLAPMVGHVGDGNFHMMLVVDPDNAAEVKRAKDVVAAIVNDAFDVGGSCTGEHGIGHGKLHFLRSEHGSDALQVMKAIKRALDPRGIMNPGKLGS